MIFSRKLLALSAISALSMAFVACDDDAADSGETTCTPGCKGDTLITCVDGKAQETNCADANLTCDSATKACIVKGDTTTCTTADNGCQSDTELKTCNLQTGKVDITKCGANQICDSKQKKCVDDVPECVDGDYMPACSSENERAYTVCESGKIATKTCAADSYCKEGSCTPDPTCSDNQILVNHVCQDKPAEENIILGRPCSCEGADCEITITGKELKGAVTLDSVKTIVGELVPAMSTMINGIIDPIIDDFNAIPDDATITAPNIFSKSIKGCEGLEAPAGMTVGCFRDSTIVFPEALYDGFLKGNGINSALPLVKVAINMFAPGLDLEKFLNKISDLLKGGIQFTSTNGYCLAATIDINGTFTDADMAGAIIKNAFAEGGLVSKINTGDHSQVKADTTCPTGGTFLRYDIPNKAVDMLGTFNVGFDMCLRACSTDADCRTADGYKCIEFPNGIPGEGQTSADLPKVKACFHPDNLTYFENMTNEFNELLPKT